MEQTTGDLIIAFAAFASFFGIAYVFLMTRYKERMAMIEKGVEASLFTQKGKSTSLTLKFGMLFIGVALGVLIGNFWHQQYGLEETVAYSSMVFLLGGISLVANFIIDRKLRRY